MIPGGDLLHEEWRPLVGWEDLYVISTMGRVRSLRANKIMATKANYLRGGYLAVGLNRDGRQRDFRVHRLMLETFVGPMPTGMVTRHLNDDPTDNRLANLKYGTHSENGLDAVSNGRNPQANQTHCKAGHELAGRNLILDKNQHRACRSCANANSRAYVERQRQRPKADLKHGTQSAYIAGCRCDECRTNRSERYHRTEKSAQAAS